MRGSTGCVVAAALVIAAAVVTLGGRATVSPQPMGTSETVAASGVEAGEAATASGVSSIRVEEAIRYTHVKASLIWCDVVAGPMTYDEAVEYCAALDHDDHYGWRLPTYWELKAIAEREGVPSSKSRTGKLYVKEPLRKRFEDVREPSVWAYCPYGDIGREASVCYDFAGGFSDGSMKSIPHCVLAVRDRVDDRWD